LVTGQMPPVSPMMQVPHWVQISSNVPKAVSLPMNIVFTAGTTIFFNCRAMV
jgi:hypothetical protein